MSAIYFLLFLLFDHAYCKLNLDGVTPDYPIGWKTEIERMQQQWKSDEKKWFDYIFDPHYDVQSFDLFGGTEIPALGINAQNKEKLYESLVFALRLGYRFIHSSISNENVEAIATAIHTVKVHATSIFVSLTIESQYFGYESTMDAVKGYLQKMELKIINLCIMGSPEVMLDEGVAEEDRLYESAKQRRLTWLAFEALKEDGVCQNLGVGHWEKKHLEELMHYAQWKPAINLIEYHPLNLRKKLHKYMVRNRMMIVSENVLNPTGDNRLRKSKVIKDLALKYSKTPSQIILKWAIQSGIIVLTSENKKQRIADHGQIYGFELEYNDISKINKMDEQREVGHNFEHVEAFQWNRSLDVQFDAQFQIKLIKIQQEVARNYRAYKNKQEL